MILEEWQDIRVIVKTYHGCESGWDGATILEVLGMKESER